MNTKSATKTKIFLSLNVSMEYDELHWEFFLVDGLDFCYRLNQ